MATHPGHYTTTGGAVALWLLAAWACVRLGGDTPQLPWTSLCRQSNSFLTFLRSSPGAPHFPIFHVRPESRSAFPQKRITSFLFLFLMESRKRAGAIFSVKNRKVSRHIPTFGSCTGRCASHRQWKLASRITFGVWENWWDYWSRKQ